VDIKARLKNLSPRERLLLYTAFVLVLVFLIYQIGFVPLLNKRAEYEKERERLEQQFRRIKNTAQDYINKKSEYTGITKTLEGKKGVPVLTYLENFARSSGIRERIEYIKPRGEDNKEGIIYTRIELKITGIMIKSLLDFLYQIEENRPGLVVTYLRLKPFFKEKDKADAIVGITDIFIELE